MRDLAIHRGRAADCRAIFYRNAGAYGKSAALAQGLGFDGVDINMGCPDKLDREAGRGRETHLNPKLAQELIAAAKSGAPKLPVCC